jgi:shikimate dehydrogenase
LGLNHRFNLYEIKEIEQIVDLIQENENLSGFCVTMPYKEKILSYLDSLSSTVKACGNVNCVKITRQNNQINLQGYNTDAFGFEYSLLNQLDISKVKQAYILGSGGVSKTISFVLAKHNIASKIVSRNPQNEQISYKQMNNEYEDFSLFINASPVGMHSLKDKIPDIDLEKLNSTAQIFDLIYNPSPTLLMQKAKEKGAIAIDGAKMLFYQAEKAWEIWQSK